MKMIKRFPVFLVVMLCMTAFIFPISAFAATDKDTTPPTLSVKLDGETLLIEATDDLSGIEAVYIDSNRVNTLVDGKASVLLKDYAGNGEKISIYAVDYASNRSDTIKINNPYYQAPVALQAPSVSSASTTNAAPSNPSTPTSTPTNTSTSSSDVTSSSSSDTGTSTVESTNALTPDGQGTVLDHVTDDEGKEFYTVVTPEGNVFYLVIDHEKNSENVFFLNAVTENDLMALAEKSSSTPASSSVGAIPTSTSEPTSEPASEPQSTSEPTKEKSGNFGSILLFFVILVGVGGAGWYLKIYKPKQDALLDDEDDFEEVEEYEGEESEYGEEPDVYEPSIEEESTEEMDENDEVLSAEPISFDTFTEEQDGDY